MPVGDPFEPGKSIGAYSLLRELGRGGMGRVYLAEDTAVGGRLVAIKVILASTGGKDALHRRFRREIRNLANLRHPNFELAGKSEINANPKDTRDHPEGVWTLPPTLRLGEKDREKYVAIGESDRMTLRFVKVAAP